MRSTLVPLMLLVPAVALAQKPDLPVTGKADAHLASFDRLMTNFVKENGVPGAALAVTKNGRLVYARGFGYADRDAKTPVDPHALFRIASVSKPFTSAAIMQLVERGKLRLDDKAFEILKLKPALEPGAQEDPRLAQITILELLQHRGGWDRDKSFDPMFRPAEIARVTGTKAPAEPKAIIEYMLGKPLQFNPGEGYNYSNFGYCVLGRIIEHVSGMTYEEYVRKEVLAPLGITAMQLGHSRLAERAKNEVHYYDGQNRSGRSVFPGGGTVPFPYGGWFIEAMDAHGGWIASASDLVRFASAFDNPAKCKILKAGSIITMFSRPPNFQGKPEDSWYACGWDVVPSGPGRFNTWHGGLLDGTSTILVRRFDGLCWAVLFNTDRNSKGEILAGKIDSLVHTAADQVKQWPAGNQFNK
jgi:CubicO group peptidase (beta-lactamase class C family)